MSSDHHPGTRPDLPSLRLCARIWARRESGVVAAPLHGRKARFVRGKPATRQDLDAAVELMYVGDAEFTECSVDALGVPVGEDLWIAAMAASNAARLQSAMDAAWVERPGARAVGRLPISQATRRVLAQQNAPHLTLKDLVARADVRTATVAAELSALVALGFYRLRRAANTGQAKPRTRKRRPSQAPTHADTAVRRLEREWRILSTADDWTVLGIPPDSGTELVERACARMLGRYARLPDHGPAGELAEKIRGRVQTAVDNVRQGSASSYARQRLMDDPITEGIRQATAGNWNAASRCFALARKQGETALNVAWLGWALYNDRTRGGDRWRQRGLELLSLAESMGGSSSDVQLLRARADLAECDYVRAWNRLERLSDQDPRDTVVRELLAEAKAGIKRQGRP
ncbi:MAG: hypothetical protein GY913_09835 [Proteobacteria bacterium]|nr:hypothetical protein [Pseudomonadota bacterium]MCP4917212.1 hypothetical protein [Pseudomonadota bacterium]